MSRRSGGTWQRQWSRARKPGGRPKHVKVLGPLGAIAALWLIAGSRPSAPGSRRPIDQRHRAPGKAFEPIRSRGVGEARSFRRRTGTAPSWTSTAGDSAAAEPTSSDTPLRSHPRFHDRGRRWGATQSPAVESVTEGIRTGATAGQNPVPTWPGTAKIGIGEAATQTEPYGSPASLVPIGIAGRGPVRICRGAHVCLERSARNRTYSCGLRSIAAAAGLAAAVGHNCARLLC